MPNVRKVRTAEGARFYGKPIGSPITAADIAKARQRSGAAGKAKGDALAAERGGGAAASRPRPRPGVAQRPEGGGSAGVQPKLPPRQAPPVPKATPSKIQAKFKEGSPTSAKEAKDLEPGTRIFSRSDSKVTYAVSPDGKGLRVFTPNGEPTNLNQADKKKLLSLLADEDAEWDTEEIPDPEAESPAGGAKKPAAGSGSSTPSPASSTPSSTAAKPAEDAKPQFRSGLDLVGGKPKEWNATSMGESVPPPSEDEIADMRMSPYTGPHLNPDGSYTEERKRLHDKIINDFLDGLEPSDNPTQYMNGGGPASGKGTMTIGENAKLTNYPPSRKVDDLTGEFMPDEEKPQAVLIDPDAIKLQFPEVKAALQRLRSPQVGENGETNLQGDPSEDQGWAGKIHEESSQLAKRIHRAALERGYNIIYDGTGNGSAKSVRSKLQAARDLGFRVEANYLYLDPEEGIKRAKARAERSNRIVPERAITGTYAAIPEIFDELAKEGAFDKVNLFDNNVERGQGAKLIGRGTADGEFEILDPEAYERFLNSPQRAKSVTTAFKQEAIQSDLNTTRSAIDARS